MLTDFQNSFTSGLRIVNELIIKDPSTP